MTAQRLSLRTAPLLLFILIVLVSTVRASSPQRSTVSLVPPAAGSAFAFGRPGHLLTTRAAIGSRRTVELVTTTGRDELATVYRTSNPLLLQLRGPLRLPSLHTRAGIYIGELVAIESGPGGGTRTAVGQIISTSGKTSIRAADTFDGAPVLAAGRLVGIATVSDGYLRVLSVRALRALVPAQHTSRGIPALAPIIIAAAGLLALVIALMLLTAAQRTRRHARTGAQRGFVPDSPPDELHVTLRRRQPLGPPPEVRLRSSSSRPRWETIAASESERPRSALPDEQT
jgi:hypothetical protein